MLSPLLEDLSSFAFFLLVITTIKITAQMVMIAAATRTTTMATTIDVVLLREDGTVVVLAMRVVLNGESMRTELLSSLKKRTEYSRPVSYINFILCIRIHTEEV